jgi:hypothetical protein
VTETTFRPYCPTDIDSCLDIFDANCPKYFAANERDEYRCFLDDVPTNYEVCEVDGQVLGAFGLLGNGEAENGLTGFCSNRIRKAWVSAPGSWKE